MKCSNSLCQRENPPHSRLCRYCGEPLQADEVASRRTGFDAGLASNGLGRASRGEPALSGIKESTLQEDPEQEISRWRSAERSGACRPGLEPAGPTAIAAVLVEYRHPDDQGRLHPLRNGRTTLGRASENTIQLARTDRRASGKHAIIEYKRGELLFMDCSTNGSIVDRRVVHGRVVTLQHGSRLQIGEARWVLLLVPDASPMGGRG